MKTIGNIIHKKPFPLYIPDKNGNIIYYETSWKFWAKSQYNTNGYRIYYEDSYGYVEDNRE